MSPKRIQLRRVLDGWRKPESGAGVFHGEAAE